MLGVFGGCVRTLRVCRRLLRLCFSFHLVVTQSPGIVVSTLACDALFVNEMFAKIFKIHGVRLWMAVCELRSVEGYACVEVTLQHYTIVQHFLFIVSEPDL